MIARFAASLLVAVAFTCSLPGRASAHAGVTAPAATNFLARLGSVPRGVQAKIIDGDQRLWLRTGPGITVVVLGFQGEPYLRFSRAGITVNTRSQAYYLNRSRPLVPPQMSVHGPPIWRLVSVGRSYSWHEDRLHALAAAARMPGSDYVGRWTIPLVVDGLRTEISGGFWHANAPSLLWFWPLVVLLASVPALIRLRSRRIEFAAASALALATLCASTSGRLGRELYGRPTLSSAQLAIVGLTCLVAVVMVALYLNSEWRWVGAMSIAGTGLYQGLALIGTLRHGFVLAAVPAVVERIATITSLAGGASLLLLTVSVSAFAGGEQRQVEAISSAATF